MHVLKQLGYLYFTMNDHYRAMQYLERALGFKETSDAWYILGRCHMKLLNFKQAYDAYQRAVDIDSTNAMVWCSIGVLFYNINQYRDALEAYSRAISLDQNFPEVTHVFCSYNRYGLT